MAIEAAVMFSLPRHVRSSIYRSAAHLSLRDKLTKHLIERPAVQEESTDYYVKLITSPQKIMILFKSKSSDVELVHDQYMYEHDLSHIKVVSQVLAVCFSCASAVSANHSEHAADLTR